MDVVRLELPGEAQCAAGNALNRARHPREHAQPAIAGLRERIEEFHEVIRQNPLLQAQQPVIRHLYPCWTCGAGQAGDLWTCTTFHLPFCLTMTRVSLCALTSTPEGSAVLM